MSTIKNRTKLGRLIDKVVHSIHMAFHGHVYEGITSTYYRENGDIRYHDTTCKCKICGKKVTLRKEVTKKRQLYQVRCITNNDSNLNCLMVGTTIDEIWTRVVNYLERVDNLQLLTSIGITPLETVDGLKININERR